MRILDVVHDVGPALQRDDEEDGGPGHADVVEGDGILEGVLLARPTVRVVLVPVDAAGVIGLIGERRRPGRLLALEVVEAAVGQVGAPVHAVVLVQAADPVLVAVLILVVRGNGAERGGWVGWK